MLQRNVLAACLLVPALIATCPDTVHGQLRRRGGDAAPALPSGAPMNARAPFAGVWEGSRIIKGGPGGVTTMPTTMVFQADSTGATYTGFFVLPNGEHAPYEKVLKDGPSLTFESRNSGGGMWKFKGRLAGRDTLTGTLALEDWPQANGMKPAGTFTLVRRGAS